MVRPSTATYDRRESLRGPFLEVNSTAGWTFTAEDIERFVSREINIVPGSVEISRVSPGNVTNTTLFRVLDGNGKTVLGRIELRLVADEKSVRMIPEIRVLGWLQWRAPRSPSTVVGR